MRGAPPQTWSQRYKRNVARIKSGDVAEVGLVVSELLIRRRNKGLSGGEQRMLRRAVQIIWAELEAGGGEAGVREPRTPGPSSGPSVQRIGYGSPLRTAGRRLPVGPIVHVASVGEPASLDGVARTAPFCCS